MEILDAVYSIQRLIKMSVKVITDSRHDIGVKVVRGTLWESPGVEYNELKVRR